MSTRSVWSRVLVLSFALIITSVFTFAAIGGSYSSLFSAGSTSAESALEPAAPEPTAPAAVIGTCDTAGPIEIESSGGTITPTAYATLKDGFDAIIAGTHIGSINVEVCGNTTETASATLTASGVGAASYTSVTIRPVGGARIIEGTIVGGVIRLNGADNVSIDGRQGGIGTARDLTVRNNSTATATAAVWLSSVAAGNGASNNTVRNLEIATGIDATSASTSATFGIIMSGTTVSATANGVDNDNNSFIANRIVKARYGIVTRGTTTDLNINPIVTDNIIGPASFGTDQIGKVGIFMQADTGALVSRNTVQNVGCLDPQLCGGADRMGIAIGNESWSATPGTITSNTYTVTKNVVHDIVEEVTFSSVGINLATTGGGTATNNLVANNFIYNVRANGTGGDMAVGLGIAGGHTDTVTFNSVSMTGDVDPGATAASTNYGSGIRIANANGTTHLNLSLTNNSVYMDLSSSSGPTVRYYAISGPSAAYSFGTGSENFNNYYINTANPQSQTGGLGTAGGATLTTQFATLALWQAAYTAPQDANSIQADPLYFSNTSDLHIQTSSPNVNAGVAVAGIAEDIDAQVRPNGPAPDIGADEFYPSAGSVQLSSSTYSVTEAATVVTITATRTGGSNGAVSVDYATVAGGSATGGASCGGATDYVNASGTLNWADLDAASKTFTITVCNDGTPEPTETVNIALTNPVGGVTLGVPNTAVLNIVNSTTFGSSVNVGTAEGVTSLTNPGGLFDQINTGVVASNLTVNITSDLTAETGTVALNQFSGGFTITIQPSGGAARLISGGNATALIDLNGADGVTIDGLITGGNTLTIRNTALGAAVRLINDASSNTITRSTLEANANGSVVFISSGVTTGNDDNSIVLNTITGRSDAVGAPFNSINLIGSSATVSNSNTLIHDNDIVNFLQAGIVVGTSDNVTFTNNDISQSVPRTTALSGVAVNSAGGTNLFSLNRIHDLTTTLATTGMTFNDARNTTVSRNTIYNFPSTTGSTGVLTGINFNGSSGNPAAVTVVNNMVSIVPAFTNTQVVLGLRDFGFGGNTFNAFYNSLLVSGTGSGAANTFACQRGSGAPTVSTWTDNICFNNRTGGTGNHFAMGDSSNGTGTLTLNYNIYVGTGATAANFFDRNATGTAIPVDFAAWQAGGRDANSQASNPGGNYTVANMFVSATDLHLANEATNPASNAGTPIAGVTTDFDGNTRSGTTPEIGADEFFVAVPGTLAFSSATYAVGEAGPTVTLTVNRSGGTDGAVTVDYALGGGTATGGAACGGSVDYVNTGGTVSFANGEASKTFTVAICSDSTFEGDETFNATLSNATGGATIGTPNPATVTITEDKGQPTVQFSSANYGITEGLVDNGVVPVAVITVTLSGPSQAAASVDYATSSGTATGGAACTAGIDFINTSGTLNFVAGDVSETFQVTICSDTEVEPNQTVNLALSNPVGTTLGTPNTAVLTITDNDVPAGGPVTVTATAGTPGPTNYPTLKDAIDAINAGTHQGAITVSIVSSTTETATSVLNSSGAGTAAYTSIVIRPVNDGVTVAGPSVIGRGLIELNGADNVTIDGDNANTAGTNRNLTIQNTAVSTINFTSVIRIALAATVVNTADNNTFRNLNILGSATGRNIATATSTTASENTTFGILAGLGASATTATTAPVPITSVSTGAPTGATGINLVVSNNNVVTAARAVSINGSATTVYPGLQITGNSIGNPVAGDVDQVTAIGITAQGSTNAVIADNTVWVEGFVASSAAGHAINVGVNSTAITGATIERNRVNRARNNNPATWSAYGINLGGGANHIVRNNFVSGVINNQTAGTGGFGTTFGAYGIRIASGTGHQIYHNSVHLYGPLPGTVSTDLTAAFVMTAVGQTGVDVRNNIFSNQITGGNPAGTRHVAVALPSGGTSAMNLTINNNAYFAGTDPLSRLAQVGAVFGAGEYQAADFDPTSTTPASNFRAYTSTLSAAGTNDNASFATTAPPPFTSNVDLHIPAGTATRIESGGAAVGVTTDIDVEPRNATTPDIGADEFAGNPPTIVNDIGAVNFVTPANGSTIPTGTITPQARFTNHGTATQTNVTVRFRILDSSMTEIYNQTATIASIAPLQIVTVSFPATTISAPGAYTMIASSELAGDQNTANDTINGSFNTVVPFMGTINVGAGETFTSLTNPGGIFQALNTAGLAGNLVVNITSDLTVETGTVALNQLAESGAGGYTVTFKPSGAARTVSGSSAVSNGLINLNGTDRAIFDGSLSGGTDRSLTITNNQTGTSTVFWVKSAGASNGATNNTVKNCIITGAGTAAAQTTAGILAGSGVTIGGPAESPNNGNTVTNNWIYRVQNSIYNQGNTGLDQNWTVTNNEFGSAVEADKNRFRGMLMGNTNNFVISGNTVLGVTNFTATTGANTGIQLAFAVTNGSVVNNRISNVRNLSTTGTGAFGLQLSATPTTNITIANNFIWDIQAIGSATVASNGFGITVNAAATTGGYKIYHNSINMNVNQTSGTSAALNVTVAAVAAGSIDLRNNILANTQTAGATRRSVHSAAPATIFSTINFNDYFSTGSVGFIGGTDRPTLADWQTGTGQDANSKAVDPLFVSPTDLHIQVGSPMVNMGITVAEVTTDIDGQTRDAMPDIGADELPPAGMPGVLQFSAPTYSVGEAGPVATITVTRTGGTDGTVTVQYATVAGGTATGGASCGAGIDYVNTSGTLTFVGGDSSETFTVPICQDPTDEPNETVNMALTNPTGGATIGAQSTAVLTIIDDDVAGGTFSINDVRRFEGNSGTVTMTFSVTYTGPTVPASVQYATSNGTALAGVDYIATAGTLFFNSPPPANGLPGPSTQNVTVTIISDVLKEANETFFVNLSNPTGGATIADGQGVGIIVDEDRAYVSDFDRDLTADYSVFRPSDGKWYVLQTTNGVPKIVSFGTNGDIAVPGDYDADGLADYAIWRPSTGQWWRLLSAGNVQLTTVFGTSGDIPVQGDYDGDAKTDLAYYRPSTGTWSITRSTDGGIMSFAFGISTDKPVQGDYDGDHKTDIAVFRNGTWYIMRSSDGAVMIANWGITGDKPVSGDFDGDGKFDLAIYRNGTWWVSNSLDGSTNAIAFGLSSDIPTPADYDADGTTDRAVFRPSTGDWWILRSSDSSVTGIHWGVSGDVPIPSAYIPQ